MANTVFQLVGALAASLLVAVHLLPGASAEAAQAADACRADSGDEGPGCSRRGAAMIQRAPKKTAKSSATMLQRLEAETPRAPMHRAPMHAQVLSPMERASLRMRAATLGKQAAATGIKLRRAMDSLSEDPSNELDHLIFQFMAGQASSQDACPAKLLEAKHQLNQLHKHMYSVAFEINSTSTEVKHATSEIEHLELEWTTEQTECSDGKQKCTTEIEEYYKQWEILKWELIEMKQIANPAVQISAANMSYAAWKSRVESNTSISSEETTQSNSSTSESSEDSGDGHVPAWDGIGDKPEWWPSMLQAAPGASAPPVGAANAVSVLVQSTKTTAKDLSNCMQMFTQGDTAGPKASALLGKTDPNGGTSSSWGDSSNGGTSSSSSSSAPVVGHSSGSSNDDGGSGSSSSIKSNSNHSYDATWSHTSSNTSSQFSNVSEACKDQLVAFEETYYKAYRQLTRLISEYEKLVNSTVCVDAVEENCKEQDRSYSLKTSKETEKLMEVTEKMSHVKGHITVMSNQEKQLTVHIQELATTCHALDETVSDLDKVRDAIHVFGECTGLGKPNFHIPVFTGQIIEFEYDATEFSDEQIDSDLNTFCRNISYDGLVARAAETSEIMQQAVEGMPTHNTADSPLMGTCPHCAGDADVRGGPVHASGHSRNCWDAGAFLDGVSMRTNCGHQSYKAVLCVVDSFDYLTTSITSGSSESSTESSSSSSSSSSASSR